MVQYSEKTQIDAFLELVQRRRSIRRFKTDAVAPEKIQNMLEAARWAMSGANAQPWEFVVVEENATRYAIAEMWLESHREVYAIEQTREPELRLSPLRTGFDTMPPWRDAPVLIIVLGDRRTLQATVLAANFLATEGADDAIYLKNIANATQMLHLAAAAQGLGSMWISLSRVWGQAIQRLLDIPDILEAHTMVAVGYAAYEPGCAYRRALADMVHYDRYDRSKYRSGEDIQTFLHSLRQRTEGAYRQGYKEH